jgi:hypothetical protein
MALFSVCYQLFSMTLFCMVVPYLRLGLHVSYFYVAIILSCSFLIEYVSPLLLGNLKCCRAPDDCQFVIQVFVSVVVMIGSLMAFFTIHVWLDVNNGDLKTLIIILASLFCCLAFYAFDAFLSRLRMTFNIFESSMPSYALPSDIRPIERSSVGFLGFFLGAAIWTGFLWFPIDFSTQAYWLFGLASIVVFSFTCLILLVFGCTMQIGHPGVLLYHPDSSIEEDQGARCCETIGKFKCSMWFSLFLVFLFNVSITPMSYFLIDWQTSCSNATCLRDFNLGFNDTNYPLHIYLYLSVTSAIGYLVLSIIAKFCYLTYRHEMTITMLAMGIFDITLFAIGYTGSQPWWIIPLLMSQGFYFSSSRFIENRLPRIINGYDGKKGASSSDDSWRHLSQYINLFAFIGRAIGMLLISFVIENSDYAKLFRILGVLVLLTGVLAIALYIRVQILESASDDSNQRVDARPPYQTKPRMIFRKSAKSA